MVKIENILWPTDFSEDSQFALDYARTLAERFGTKLFLLHVIDNPTSPAYGEVEGDYFAMEANARKKARELLDGYMKQRLSDFPNKEALLKEGDVLSRIMDTVSERAVGTIVMGTHGRSGVSHILMGSVTEKIIRSVTCPVYAVRHPRRAPK